MNTERTWKPDLRLCEVAKSAYGGVRVEREETPKCRSAAEIPIPRVPIPSGSGSKSGVGSEGSRAPAPDAGAARGRVPSRFIPGSRGPQTTWVLCQPLPGRLLGERTSLEQATLVQLAYVDLTRSGSWRCSIPPHGSYTPLRAHFTSNKPRAFADQNMSVKRPPFTDMFCSAPKFQKFSLDPCASRVTRCLTVQIRR
jgi:hypothetical protein